MVKKYCLFIFVAALLLTSCARRTNITGGAKDTIAPQLRSSIPKNYNTNFKGNQIKLIFDEYVKLKNVAKQLIVSPPLKTVPQITPVSASKQITITLTDSLLPNTTYSFNFWKSIEDNNEGNALQNFKYVFSTGNQIDSLTLQGTIKDAYEKQPDPFVSVMLYEAATFTDSTIYNQTPKYITSTLDSTSVFKLDHIEAGNYLLIALKDHNSNNKFDPNSDKIAFHRQPIKIPNDTLYEMELFQEEKPFKLVKATQTSGNKLLLAYEGNPSDVVVRVEHNSELLQTVLSKVPNKDSLLVWHESKKADSLRLTITKGRYEKNLFVKLKNQKTDSLALSSSGGLHLRDMAKLKTTVPIKSVNDKLISITDKDNAGVAFRSEVDNYNLFVNFEFDRQPVQRYTMTLLPGALVDFFDRPSDTLSFSFSTRNTTDYGNLRLSLEQVKKYPLIVELADTKGKLVDAKKVLAPGPIEFALIDPDSYLVRVIYDSNSNGRWDSGNYLKKEQPEEVLYYYKPIDVRANWDVEQVFRLP